MTADKHYVPIIRDSKAAMKSESTFRFEGMHPEARMTMQRIADLAFSDAYCTKPSETLRRVWVNLHGAPMAQAHYLSLWTLMGQRDLNRPLTISTWAVSRAVEKLADELFLLLNKHHSMEEEYMAYCQADDIAVSSHELMRAQSLYDSVLAADVRPT